MTTPAGTFPAELVDAAQRRGVQLSYYDVFGRQWIPPKEVVERILAALGPEPAAKGVVITPGMEVELEPGSVLRLESGESRPVTRLDDRLPWGYHQLEQPGRSAIPVAVCPGQMWRPDGNARAAGIAIALYGLRSKRNWGVGDFRDLGEFCRWAASRLGAQFVALNPLHAIHNREPYNASPYLPVSSYFRNYLYLDIEALPEFSSPELQSLWGSEEVQAELVRLREAELVDYGACARLKLRFLHAAWRQGQSARSAEFASFRAAAGLDLGRFTLFCALDQYFRETRPGTWLWTEWPAEYHDPDSEACREFAVRHADILGFFAWIQWLISIQLAFAQETARQAGMSIGLYHDLALATDRYGCDLWASRSRFVTGCRVGSPPDSFSPEGQDWAFPPPNTSALAVDGYAAFAASIRCNAAPGGALRLDHVMRLFRLFWIPDGFGAKDGTYVREPWRELLGILALESHRLRFRVIGEDLGTVTDEIRAGLTGSGVLGYRLLMFEKEGGRFRPPERYPATAVASVTTHDLATLAGYWQGQDIEARQAAGLLPDPASYTGQWDERRRDRQALLDALRGAKLLPQGCPLDASKVPALDDALRHAAIEFLARTPCELLVLNQEDLTGEVWQQNLPGSTSEYPNWKRKMRIAVESLDELNTAAISALLRRTGRRGE